MQPGSLLLQQSHGAGKGSGWRIVRLPMHVPARTRGVPAAEFPFVRARLPRPCLRVWRQVRRVVHYVPRRALPARSSAARVSELARIPDVLAVVCGLSLLLGTAGAYTYTYMYSASICKSIHVPFQTPLHAHTHTSIKHMYRKHTRTHTHARKRQRDAVGRRVCRALIFSMHVNVHIRVSMHTLAHTHSRARSACFPPRPLSLCVCVCVCVCARARTHTHTHICNPGHRVSKPRGTGSVGDSVGEGTQACGWLRRCVHACMDVRSETCECECVSDHL